MRRGEVPALAGPLAKRSPQRRFLAAVSEIEQLLLVPADQRRNEQIGEVQIVQRLDREAHRSKQVANRKRLGQEQPVDARDRHAPLEQARDDERRKLAPAANQDQDVARR